MSIIDLTNFKTFLRELSSDLDSAFTLAINAAEAEVNNHLGFDADTEFNGDPPGDVVMACLLLAQVFADAGDPEANRYRRTAAHNLLAPHRTCTGIGGA
ncbi:MAG: head-tail connector protein [Pseudomonas sp.]